MNPYKKENLNDSPRPEGRGTDPLANPNLKRSGGLARAGGKTGGVFVTSIFFAIYLLSYSSCVTFGASAEEYYSIGMAYFELGKFEEAERWLNRAKAADKTRVASEYNLGRIAFETGRYGEAALIFDRILAKDPQNTMALKAAAYTRIKTGELTMAEQYYQRILALIPESADDGYNYALVLFAVKKFEEAEKTLLKNPYVLEENKDALLLYARTQKAQNKVEAVDTYAKFLLNNSDPKARYEYAQTLEGAELYAKAIEEYRATLNELFQDATDLKRQDVRFSLARVLLIADGENPEGLTELEGAVSNDFTDLEALENLSTDEKISLKNREQIRNIITRMRQGSTEPEAGAGSEESL
jgi:tetratricopeptide (TPR) repeat protein